MGKKTRISYDMKCESPFPYITLHDDMRVFMTLFVNVSGRLLSIMSSGLILVFRRMFGHDFPCLGC